MSPLPSLCCPLFLFAPTNMVPVAVKDTEMAITAMEMHMKGRSARRIARPGGMRNPFP